MDNLSAWPCAPSSGVAQGGITALTDRHALKALRHMPELWRVSTVFYYFEKNGNTLVRIKPNTGKYIFAIPGDIK